MKSEKNRRFGPAKRKVAIEVVYLSTIIVEKIAYKEDAVYYKRVNSKAVESVSYGAFLQAAKHESVYLLTMKTRSTTSEFDAISIVPFKNKHLVKCTGEHSQEVVINIASLVKVPK